MNIHYDYPQHLSAEEISNPFAVVRSTYMEFDLPILRKCIQRWLKSVYIKKKWKKHGPGNTLYFYEQLIRLVEAASLIRQLDTSNRAANLSEKVNLESESVLDLDLFCSQSQREVSWHFFPRSLTPKQFVNPYLVFDKFFELKSLGEWRDDLHNLLHLSLTAYDPSALGELLDILSIQRRLCQLADATHLINIREFFPERHTSIIEANNTEYER